MSGALRGALFLPSKACDNLSHLHINNMLL